MSGRARGSGGPAARRTSSQGSRPPLPTVEGHVCWFCKEPGDDSVPGELADLHVTAPCAALGGHAILYHEPCVGYCNVVHGFQSAIDERAEDDEPEITGADVEAAWRACHSLPCAACGRGGASICCLSKDCGENFHFPCARKAAQGGWAGGRTAFHKDQRVMACPRHAQKVDAIVEPQGIFFERCGGWNGKADEAGNGSEEVAHASQPTAPQAGPASPAAEPSAGAAAQQPGAASEQARPLQAGSGAGQPVGEVSGPSQPPQAAAAQRRPAVAGMAALQRMMNRLKLPPAAQPSAPLAGQPGYKPVVGWRSRVAGRNRPPVAGGSAAGPAAAAATAAAAAAPADDVAGRAAPPALPRAGSAAATGSTDGWQQQQQGAERSAPTAQGAGTSGSRGWDIPGHVWEPTGCITRPVPTRPGEIRVLGHTITQAEVRKSVLEEYKQLMVDEPRVYGAVRVVSKNTEAKERPKVEKAFKAVIAANSPGGVFNLGRLPAELPIYRDLEAFDIPPDDECVGLAKEPGAKGLRNALYKRGADGEVLRDARGQPVKNDPIPPYTVLGTYQCLQMSTRELQMMAKDKDLKAKLGITSSIELEFRLDSYAADTEVLPDTKNCFNLAQRGVVINKLKLSERRGLVYSAYLYGNETALINDVCKDPIREIEEMDVQHLSRAKTENCKMVEALVGGWPFLFFITGDKPVQPGEELVTSYGDLYWENLVRVLEKKRNFEAELQENLAQTLQQPSGLSGQPHAAAAPAATANLVTQGSGVRPGIATTALREADEGITNKASAEGSGEHAASMPPLPRRAAGAPQPTRFARAGARAVKFDEEAAALPAGPAAGQGGAAEEVAEAADPSSSEGTGLAVEVKAGSHSPQARLPASPFAAAAAVAAAAEEAAAAVQQALPKVKVEASTSGGALPLDQVFSSPASGELPLAPAGGAGAHVIDLTADSPVQPAPNKRVAHGVISGKPAAQRGSGSGSREEDRERGPRSKGDRERGGSGKKGRERDSNGGEREGRKRPHSSGQSRSPRRERQPAVVSPPLARRLSKDSDVVSPKARRTIGSRQGEPERGRTISPLAAPAPLTSPRSRQRLHSRSRSCGRSPEEEMEERRRRRARSRSRERSRDRRVKEKLGKWQRPGSGSLAAEPKEPLAAAGLLKSVQEPSPVQQQRQQQQRQQQQLEQREQRPADRDPRRAAPSLPKPPPPIRTEPRPPEHHQRRWDTGPQPFAAGPSAPTMPQPQPRAVQPPAVVLASTYPACPAPSVPAALPQAVSAVDIVDGGFEMASPEGSPTAAAAAVAGRPAPALLELPPHLAIYAAAPGAAAPGAAAPGAAAPAPGPLGQGPDVTAGATRQQCRQQQQPLDRLPAHLQPQASPPQQGSSLRGAPVSQQPAAPLSMWDSPPASPQVAAAALAAGGKTPDVALEAGEGTPDVVEDATPDHLAGEGLTDLLDGHAYPCGEPPTPDLNDLDLPPPPPYLLERYAHLHAGEVQWEEAQRAGSAQAAQQAAQQAEQEPLCWEPADVEPAAGQQSEWEEPDSPERAQPPPPAQQLQQEEWEWEPADDSPSHGGAPIAAAPPAQQPLLAPMQSVSSLPVLQQQCSGGGGTALQGHAWAPSSSLPARVVHTDGPPAVAAAPSSAPRGMLGRALSGAAAAAQQQPPPGGGNNGGGQAAAAPAVPAGAGRGLVRLDTRLSTSAQGRPKDQTLRWRERQEAKSAAAAADAQPVGRVGAAEHNRAATLRGLRPSGHAQQE